MNNEMKVLNLLSKNNGLLSKKQLINIPNITLTRLIKKGKIERLNTGLYARPNVFSDDYYTLVYNTNNAVFSYFTALYLQDLCEKVPQIYDITVLKNYGGSLQKKENVCLHYVDEKKINLGKIKIKTPQGNEVYCYDIERCLCDLIKDRDNLYFEYIKYAFVEYYRNQKHNTFKLFKYAKILGIEKKVQEFMEVLL